MARQLTGPSQGNLQVNDKKNEQVHDMATGMSKITENQQVYDMATCINAYP
jgi:hypothetical protein